MLKIASHDWVMLLSVVVQINLPVIFYLLYILFYVSGNERPFQSLNCCRGDPPYPDGLSLF